MTKKRIGVLTSGGDCAGLNACIRAIVMRAKKAYDWDILGIRYGSLALPVYAVELDENICSAAMIRSPGTILGSTSKRNDIAHPKNIPHQYIQDFLTGYKELGLDALIGIGGDGSMHILNTIAQHGDINLVAVPKTIDNDLGHTDMAIGFSSAIEVATQALDRLQPTAASHQRVMILEVMGRDAGHIALHSGLAGGADVILIPEISYSIQDICAHIDAIHNNGRNFSLIVVAESVKMECGTPATVHQGGERQRYGGIGQYLADQIKQRMDAETRVTVLGHVQRGVEPVAWDRIIASALGVAAVDMIHKGKFQHMVAWSKGNIEEIPIQDAIAHYRVVQKNDILLKTALKLGTYLGHVSTE